MPTTAVPVPRGPMNATPSPIIDRPVEGACFAVRCKINSRLQYLNELSAVFQPPRLFIPQQATSARRRTLAVAGSNAVEGETLKSVSLRQELTRKAIE